MKEYHIFEEESSKNNDIMNKLQYVMLPSMLHAVYHRWRSVRGCLRRLVETVQQDSSSQNTQG